jgi:hypothetical protein
VGNSSQTGDGKVIRSIKTGSVDMLNSTSVSLFYAYSRFDAPFSHELEKHLSLLRREGLITEWYSREITTETDGTNIPEQHLDTAQLILLLISPDFLAVICWISWRVSASKWWRL